MGDCTSNQKLKPEPVQKYSDQGMIDSEKLYSVKDQQMLERMHRFNTSIIWRIGKTVGRGSGILISENVVLTCAHNFEYSGQQIDKNLIQIYPGANGILRNPFRVEQIFIPKEYFTAQPTKNIIFDYALLKLSKRVQYNDFIPLKPNAFNQTQKEVNASIAIFGYPQTSYENGGLKQTYTEKVTQCGLSKENCKIINARQRKEIRYQLSTLRGQSGAGVILKSGNQLQIIGIHKGGVKVQAAPNKSAEQYNCARLITQQLLKSLREEILKMRGQLFSTGNPAQIQRDPKRDRIEAIKCNQKGDIQLNNNNFQQAAECYEKAIYLSPSYAVSYNNLARAYFNLKKYKQAKENCKKAISLQADFKFYKHLTLILQKAEEIDQLLECYTKIISMNKTDIQAYMNIAKIYKNRNQYEEAIKEYEKVHKISQFYYEAYFQKGICYNKLQKYDQALLNFEKANQLKPQNSFIHRYIGQTLMNKREYKRAKTSFVRYLEDDPENEEVKLMVSQLLVRQSI